MKEPCQQINIDPSRALNLQPVNTDETESMQMLRVSPNPAQSVVTLTTTDGSKLTGGSKNAMIRIYNYAMQAEKIMNVFPAHGNSIQIPVGQLTPGIYRIQLIRGNETLGCSFIKE